MHQISMLTENYGIDRVNTYSSEIGDEVLDELLSLIQHGGHAGVHGNHGAVPQPSRAMQQKGVHQLAQPAT